MKKLTEEIWNKAVEENTSVSPIATNELSCPVHYILAMMRYIYKTEVEWLTFGRLGLTGEDLTEEHYRCINELIIEASKFFSLSPAINKVVNEGFIADKTCSWCSGGGPDISKKSKVIIRPTFLFGEGMLITIRSKGKYLFPDQIYYTSESAHKVVDIYNYFLDKTLETRNRLNKVGDSLNYSVQFLYIDEKENSLEFSGLRKSELKREFNIYENFNDSLPLDKLNQFIQSNDGGIAILHGKPGCGKTTLLRYLIATNPSVTYYICPQEILIRDMEKFKNKLYDNSGNIENRIFIVEDCERLLKSREYSHDSGHTLGELLNITDGILGDFLKTKFIFTFNTDLTNIDTAILRKGRLKIKYEVSPLIGDKLENLAKKRRIVLNKEQRENGMPLADIYNYYDTVEINTVPKKKIGF